MEFVDLSPDDLKLIEAAQQVLRDNYVPGRHTSGAAVLCASGKVYRGVNIETCGFGTCAEPVALGAAFTAGERKVVSVVSVAKRVNNYPIVSPCGNCRQLLVDYVPGAQVILDYNGSLQKTEARNLLPGVFVFDETF
jgi:cytidine deaminase